MLNANMEKTSKKKVKKKVKVKVKNSPNVFAKEHLNLI